MTSSPLARKSLWKPALGRKNDGDSLPATKGVSDFSSMVIYPVVGWGCRLKPGFSVPVPARCERESCPERNPRPTHSNRWSLVEEGSTPVWAAAAWRGCDEWLPPPLIIITPSFNAALHQAPDGSGCVREEGRWNSQVWRRVMRHTWHEWSLMNEWMMHLYSALLCIAVHPKHFTIMWGVSPQPPPVCSIHLDDTTAATGQWHQCAHHTPATGGEERES